MDAWGWPQFAYLGLILVGVGVLMSKHGDPHPPYNLWTAVLYSLPAYWLLYMGGFWS